MARRRSRAGSGRPSENGAARALRRGRMLRARGIEAVRAAVSRWRARGDEVHFVPTMGAIHAGHLSLVRCAREGRPGPPSASRRRRVIASIFVNPLQFGPTEDFRRYPRPVRRDRAALAGAGTDLLWEPQVTDLY